MVTFIALQIGGDQTYLFVSERASPEEIEETRKMLGFDKPLHIQYLIYLSNLIQFTDCVNFASGTCYSHKSATDVL